MDIISKGRLIDRYAVRTSGGDEHQDTSGHDSYDPPYTVSSKYSKKRKSNSDDTESGAFFGEEALLGQSLRRCGAVCVTFCDLFLLRREDFEKVLTDFPRFRDVVKHFSYEQKWERISKQRGQAKAKYEERGERDRWSEDRGEGEWSEDVGEESRETGESVEDSEGMKGKEERKERRSEKRKE